MNHIIENVISRLPNDKYILYLALMSVDKPPILLKIFSFHESINASDRLKKIADYIQSFPEEFLEIIEVLVTQINSVWTVDCDNFPIYLRETILRDLVGPIQYSSKSKISHEEIVINFFLSLDNKSMVDFLFSNEYLDLSLSPSPLVCL